MANQRFGQVDGQALGVAMGVLWSGAVVVLGITARLGWGDEWRELLADVYLGYDTTSKGLIVGSLWAFADAFVGAYTLAWLYNRIRQSMH
jgi:hypothetical protein